MSLVISVRDENVVIELAGVVDLGGTPALHSVLNDAIDAGFDRLVIDVSGVTILSADAIGAIVAARRRIDGSIRVVGAQDLLRTEFEVLDLVDLLDLDAPADRVADHGG